MAGKTVSVDLAGTSSKSGTSSTSGSSDLFVADPADVPDNITMMYFDNDDNTGVVCWMLDTKQDQDAQLVTTVEKWMSMQGRTTQQIMDMLVKAANQDGHFRTGLATPMRRPRILLVNSPVMGGLRGISLESNNGSWLTMKFRQVSYFFKPYRFWNLPGEDEHGDDNDVD
jgi:hypothetical protein